MAIILENTTSLNTPTIKGKSHLLMVLDSTFLKIFVVICCLIFKPYKDFGQSLSSIPTPEAVDSFRMVITDGFNYNEKIFIFDTLAFVQTGIYAFVNYDQTSTLHDVLLCYEAGYNKEPEPSLSNVATQQLRMIRDIRWLFLFYLDQYVLRTPSNSNKVHKNSRVNLLNIKKDDYVDILGEEGFELVIQLYQQLIIAMNKKTFYEKVIESKSVSLLEFIGYRWEIKD